MLSELSDCKTRIYNQSPGDMAAKADSALDIFNLEIQEEVMAEISSWPDYEPTPLISLPGLAKALGIRQIWYKDEGGRFGLGSFKALGGAYAVKRLLQGEITRRTGVDNISFADLAGGQFDEIVADITVTCATDGNHGRSVSWGASLFGCKCNIFLHQGVSAAREKAIVGLGADIIRVGGNYDDSVEIAAAQAKENGWFVVSDTSYEGYADIPCQVMQGYTVMGSEIIAQMPDGERPTHVAAQGGVGGLAAAIFGQLKHRWREGRPRFVVIEPERAACLIESAIAGHPVRLQGSLDTIMAGLACSEPSYVAWSLLEQIVDDFVVIPDKAAAICMRALASGTGDDQYIVAGESGVAGLAGIAAAIVTGQGGKIGLDSSSSLLVVGTEGDTDPETYVRIVGQSGAEVMAGNPTN